VEGERVSTFTSALGSPFRRGDSFVISDLSQSDPQRISTAPFGRITHTTETVLTYRLQHNWGILEWLHARCEDWILWPLRDLLDE
jgi:hypothetical protein